MDGQVIDMKETARADVSSHIKGLETFAMHAERPDLISHMLKNVKTIVEENGLTFQEFNFESFEHLQSHIRNMLAQGFLIKFRYKKANNKPGLKDLAKYITKQLVLADRTLADINTNTSELGITNEDLVRWIAHYQKTIAANPSMDENNLLKLQKRIAFWEKLKT